MIGYLQSQDRFKDRLIIGPDERLVRAALESETGHLPIVGSFSYAAGQRVMFYRWDGDLRLRVGDTVPVNLKSVTADWSRSGDLVTFVLRRQGQNILKEVYPLSPDIRSIDGDPTAFVEPEDFDIFMLVRNVLHDHDRADRIYPSAVKG